MRRGKRERDNSNTKKNKGTKIKSETGVRVERKHVCETATEEQKVLTMPAKPQTEVQWAGGEGGLGRGGVGDYEEIGPE